MHRTEAGPAHSGLSGTRPHVAGQRGARPLQQQGYDPGSAPSEHEEAMKVRIKWVEEVSFLAQTESSHTILMDGAPEGGGRMMVARQTPRWED